jgi:hypothetical protein
MIIFLLSFREREQKNVYRLIEKGGGGESLWQNVTDFWLAKRNKNV